MAIICRYCKERIMDMVRGCTNPACLTNKNKPSWKMASPRRQSKVHKEAIKSFERYIKENINK